MTPPSRSARTLRRNHPLLSPVIAGHLDRQKTLGRFMTRVDVAADPAQGRAEAAGLSACPDRC